MADADHPTFGVGPSQRDWRARTLHFVGAGGCGMSGLALVAQTLGASVTGSDRVETPFLAALRRRGIRITIGHDAANLPVDQRAEVVHSAAVDLGNPERVAARARGLRERPRGDLLAEVCALKRCIAVAGTHGKSTTAAMIAHALTGAAERPSFVIGALLLDRDVNAHWDTGSWLVVETDESDRSLLMLRPDIAVVTNVELEHVRTYATRADVDDAFRAFLARARQAVLWDRPDVGALRDGPAVVFDARDVRAGPGGIVLQWRDRDVALPALGAHNALNAAAALEACALAGADVARCADALATFAGIGRRMQALGRTPAGARVFDDYAHHPTAVAATLAAARTLGARRVVAVLQPHSHARVAALAPAFAAALRGADRAIVLPIIGRDRPEDHPGVSAQSIADAAGAHVVAVDGLDAAAACLSTELQDGDVCVTLGPGDVDALARLLVE